MPVENCSEGLNSVSTDGSDGGNARSSAMAATGEETVVFIGEGV